jgi:hypothetical protein
MISCRCIAGALRADRIAAPGVLPARTPAIFHEGHEDYGVAGGVADTARLG